MHSIPNTLNPKSTDPITPMDTNPSPKRRTILQSCESFIPIGIINQILLLLPARYLIKLKSVCKSWFNLISDPKFTTQHTHLSLQSPPRPVIVTSPDFRPGDRRELYFFDVVSEISKKMTIGKYLRRAGDVPDLDYEIRFCSSSGLLLFYSVYSMSVFNPLTREITQLPSIWSPIDFCDIVGLSVDSTTGKYCVVRFFVASNCDLGGCHVLEQGSSSWVTVNCGVPPDVVRMREDFTLVNGVLYWRTLGEITDSSEQILSFGSKGGYELFPTPPVPSKICLGSIQGRVCVVHCGLNLVTDVWTLKEGGQREWSKWCTFNLPVSQLPAMTPVHVRAIYEGSVWLVNSGELFRYDPETEELVQIDTTGTKGKMKMPYPKFGYTMGFHYVETLAPTWFRVDFGLCFSTLTILAAVPTSQSEGFRDSCHVDVAYKVHGIADELQI